jgi:hypothetical protein
MSKEQIEEMAKVVAEVQYLGGLEQKVAELLYDKGYRKQIEGHWFILEYEYFTCSECGYYHPNGCDTTKEAKEKLAEGIYPKYCADCGAKMKGGVE